jgi:hypothetical protein
MHIGCVGLMVMIRVVQLHHGGTFPRLSWDPGITLLDGSTTIRDVSVNFEFPMFTFGKLRSGFLEEWYSEELTKSKYIMID